VYTFSRLLLRAKRLKYSCVYNRFLIFKRKKKNKNGIKAGKAINHADVVVVAWPASAWSVFDIDWFSGKTPFSVNTYVSEMTTTNNNNNNGKKSCKTNGFLAALGIYEKATGYRRNNVNIILGYRGSGIPRFDFAVCALGAGLPQMKSRMCGCSRPSNF